MFSYWIAFYAFILLIFAVFAILFRRVFVIKSNFGTFAPPVVVSCSAKCDGTTTTSTGLGLQLSECIPNPTTGLGCLTSDNKQTFLPQTQTVTCQRTCPSQVWQTVSTSPCQALNSQGQVIPTSQCLTSSDTYFPTVTSVRTCISTGINSNLNQCQRNDGTFASVGQSEVITSNCNQIPNPSCGVFATCGGALPFQYLPNIMTTFSAPYNLFNDGVLAVSEVCSYTLPDGSINNITPSPNEPATTLCSPFGGNCRALPNSAQVALKSIPNPQVQNVCGNNPSCLTVGRLYPGNSSLLTNNYLIELYNHPTVITKIINGVINFLTINPGTNGLVFQPVVNRPACSNANTITSNGLLIWFSPTANSPNNILSCRLMGLNASADFGWLLPNGNYVVFSPVAPNYLSSDLLTPASGSNYLNAIVATVMVGANITVPPDYPSGTVGRSIDIPNLLVENSNLLGCNLYILPAVTNLNQLDTLPYRTVPNPCLF